MISQSRTAWWGFASRHFQTNYSNNTDINQVKIKIFEKAILAPEIFLNYFTNMHAPRNSKLRTIT